MITAVCARPYRLALRRPWHNARGALSERRGWIITMETEDGRRGLGDCAPLPEAGTESLEAAAEALADAVRRPGALPSTATPAARNAIECALLDLEAQALGLPLARLLAPTAAASVMVNAACGPLDEHAPARVGAALEAGFAVVKLKAGLRTVAEECAVMARMPAAARLRLDANGAWGVDEARRMCEAAGLESVEEPLAGADAETLSRLQDAVAVPLALDESVARGPLPRPFPVRRLVIKPMAVGGLRAAITRAEGIAEVVVTTTIDSAVGTWAAAHLAAALDTGAAHGLATSQWLAADLAAPPPISGGRIVLGDAPGLGLA